MKIIISLIIFFALLFTGPLYVYLHLDSNLDWQRSRRSSANIAPSANTHPEAIIQVYAAKAFSWRGVFGVHTWYSLKPKNADHYTVLHVLGWRSMVRLPVVSIEEDIPDRFWFNQEPVIIADVRGSRAESLIPDIEALAHHYAYSDRYVIWPGPNSNTFTASIARKLPELHIAFPPIALGKDFLPFGTYFAPAPSNTGFQFSFLGLLGLLIAEEEGIELNIIGLVFGVNLKNHTLKLPGFGEIKL